MNYFELYGMPARPVADHTYVSKKYLELQRTYHPDFFTQEDENAKEEALEKSAVINKAYSIFRNKEKTIAYFLETQGLISENEKYELPADFLMEMMELNESLMEEGEADVRKKIEDYHQNLWNEIAPLLDKNEISAPAEMELLKAYYYKKKYLSRILDRLGD
ncbi:MAG: iron-sulfur cluster co-chaperone HscB C-terminal domain-containing protein [Ferruginibacter sp.]